LEIRGFFKCR